MSNNNQIKLKGKMKTYMQWPLYMGLLMVTMNAAMFMVNKKAGMVMAVYVLIYLIVASVLNFKMKPTILRSMVDFAVGYSQIQKQVLKELELPYALLDSSEKILWMNDAFSRIITDGDAEGKHICSVFPQIPKEIMPTDEEIITIRIAYNNKDYKVELKRMYIDELMENNDLVGTTDAPYLISVYVFDETEINEYIKYISDEKFVAGLVYIDNYDEALESVEEVRRSLLVGLVDRKINKSFGMDGGLVKKLEKDKYLVVMRYKALMQLQNEKFNVLEEVKSISIGNEMAVTVSVGIGAGEDSYIKNYELARSSMELALGRGGDQVVIKEGEKVTYFGGKSHQQEKNTRVRARVKAQALKEIIETKDKIFVMGHQLGDVDSFGASIGICKVAQALNKKAYVIADNLTVSVIPMKDKLMQTAEYEKDVFISAEVAKELVDANSAVVVVDVNKPSLTECPELLERCKTKVVIDHHRQGSETIEGAMLSYVEPFASSACEMVAEILQYIKEGIKLKPIEADVLYAGMVIDTNNFTNKSGVRTFEAAAFLKKCGADTIRVRKLLRNDMKDYKARADAISHAQVFRENYAITTSKASDLASPTIVAAQVANELLDVNGIKASFVLTMYNDKVYISARSMDEVNVQLIMEKLGGGGHMSVAGAQLTGCTMEDAYRLVRSTVESAIDNNEI